MRSIQQNCSGGDIWSAQCGDNVEDDVHEVHMSHKHEVVFEFSSEHMMTTAHFYELVRRHEVYDWGDSA